MKNPSNTLKELDPKQFEVVTSTEGPLLVFAGAGSGKTRSIIYRTAYLIRELGVPLWKILLVTFTNKAANELKERLYSHFSINIRSFWVGTFHSICARILRSEANKETLGFNSNFSIFDTEDSLSLLRKIYKEMNVSKESYPLKKVFHIISSTKSSLITPENYFEIHPENRSTVMVHKIYSKYQQKLRENNSLDFDDLLMVTANLLSDDDEVRQKYCDKFDYIMIDEYQDTNYAQFKIARLLSGEKRNICVVGDDDQAIYSWRGATIKNILNFSSDFLNAKTVRLEQNYRSTQQILDKANNLIAENKTRHPKVLWTMVKEGEEPVLHTYENDMDEVEGVIKTAANLFSKHGMDETCVVLYRTNAQSRIFEKGCRQFQMPYKIHGAINFYQRKEIKDIVAYLRVFINPDDSESLLRIVNFPPRGIGQTTIKKLLFYSGQSGLSIYRIMEHISASMRQGSTGNEDDIEKIIGVNKGTANKIVKFFSLIERFSMMAPNTEIATLVEELCRSTAILEEYDSCIDYKDTVRLENITEFLASVKEYADNYLSENNEPPLIDGFLQYISLLSSLDAEYSGSEDQKANRLNLMTLHNAKGLEFDNVFIVGVEEKLLPHNMCGNSNEEVEEERRLVYVGMTRAKKRLYISHARFRRSIYGYEATYPSRFIHEIFPGRTAKRTIKKDTKAHLNRPEISHLAKKQPKGSPYRIGQRVNHDKFGKGTVLNVDGSDEKTNLTINFDGGFLKKVRADYVQILTK